MALDMYRSDNNKHELSINHRHYTHLKNIFYDFGSSTGIFIIECRDTTLDIKQIEKLIEVIDNHLKTNDLNKGKYFRGNPEGLTFIVEFKELLQYLVEENVSIYFIGD